MKVMHDLILIDKYKYKRIIFFPVSTFFKITSIKTDGISYVHLETDEWKWNEMEKKCRKREKMICLI